MLSRERLQELLKDAISLLAQAEGQLGDYGESEEGDWGMKTIRGDIADFLLMVKNAES